MATQSIKKNIEIHDQDSAAAFIEALEKAASLSAKSVPHDKNIKELKGTANIKDFFGDNL